MRRLLAAIAFLTRLPVPAGLTFDGADVGRSTLLFPIVGSIVYFAVGRPVRTAPSSTWRAGGGFPESTRPARAPE